ncbi:Uncharacterised protein [Klebsiella oxytoca]|nr:Uncharacterised protein [Klebsiella oxytoca]
MNALSNTDFKKISNNARPKRLGYYASWGRLRKRKIKHAKPVAAAVAA